MVTGVKLQTKLNEKCCAVGTRRLQLQGGKPKDEACLKLSSRSSPSSKDKLLHTT